MADVNVFLLNILPDKYFKSFFEWLSLRWQFAPITSWAWRFFEHRYFTRWCCDIVKVWWDCKIFVFFVVANLPLSLAVKEFWKSVNIWRSHGKSLVLVSYYFDSLSFDYFALKMPQHPAQIITINAILFYYFIWLRIIKIINSDITATKYTYD